LRQFRAAAPKYSLAPRNSAESGAIVMLQFFSGLAVASSGVAGLWYCWPRNGQAHPLIVMPVLDSLIPIAIVTALALGTALIISGVLV
jgi:hypothetical protein